MLIPYGHDKETKRHEQLFLMAVPKDALDAAGLPSDDGHRLFAFTRRKLTYAKDRAVFTDEEHENIRKLLQHPDYQIDADQLRSALSYTWIRIRAHDLHEQVVQKTVEQLNQRHTQDEIDNTELSGMVDDLERKIKQFEHGISVLEADLKEREEFAAVHQKLAKERLDAMDKMSEILDNLESENKTLRGKLRNFEMQVEGLTQENERLVEQDGALKESLAEQTEEAMIGRHTIEGLKASNAELEETNKQRGLARDKLNEQLYDAKVAHRTLQEKFSETEELLDSTEKVKAAQHDVIQAKEAELEMSKSTIETLKDTVKVSAVASDALQNELMKWKPLDRWDSFLMACVHIWYTIRGVPHVIK